MIIISIPQTTLKENQRVEKSLEPHEVPWWRIKAARITHGILAKSTGTGHIKAGITVYLIAAHGRKVYVGKELSEITVTEYVGLVENTGWQALVQIGRDVEMVESVIVDDNGKTHQS